MSFPFVKGHGTENDFVVLPDLDGSVHGDLDPAVVVEVCDRRSGIGADGVLRVLRGNVDDGHAEWFMDHRNADGSVSEMCGNGVRVFARYLADVGLVDTSQPVAIDTRDGVKMVTFADDGEISVDMGKPKVGGDVKVDVGGRVFPARDVDLGNPHAVAFVDSLDEAGELRGSPMFSAADYPNGVNIEFVVRRGPGQVAMRVYERGVGETRSCGTGACAVAVATALADAGSAASPAAEGWEGIPHLPSATAGEGVVYRVEMPGGLLTVTWAEDGHIHLKGPAVLVAAGTWTG